VYTGYFKVFIYPSLSPIVGGQFTNHPEASLCLDFGGVVSNPDKGIEFKGWLIVLGLVHAYITEGQFEASQFGPHAAWKTPFPCIKIRRFVRDPYILEINGRNIHVNIWVKGRRQP
jgi:hypothetical protein